MGLALIWVMLFHAYNLHFYRPALDYIKEYGYLGVDVFIFLSGLGLAVSLLRKPAALAFWKARCFRVLPAYWLAAGLYSLLLVLAGRIPFSTLLWNLSCLHYWLQIPDSFNWYISALLAFYLMAPFWVRLLRNSGHPELLTLAVFPASYGLYRLFIHTNLKYTRDFLFRLPSFAAGALCGYCFYAKKALSRKHLCLWGILTLTGGYLFFGLQAGKLYISPCFIFALAVCPLCLLAAWLLELTGWRWRVLSLLGECSLEIYLLNVIITREFGPLAALTGLTGHPLRFYLLTYAANITLGILLHKALEKLPRIMKKKAVSTAPV